MVDKSSVSTPRKPSGLSDQKYIMMTQTLSKTRTVDAFFAAGGAAGSLALLQAIHDYLVIHTSIETPIIGGFLAGSALKFFLNRNPPTLEAFWKSTTFSILMGSSVHSMLWINGPGEDGMTTIVSKEYMNYLILFFMILFWKLEAGSIWGAGSALASHIAYQSGPWGKNASTNEDFLSLMGDFPMWFILRPYLVGHLYLYICALGLSIIRRRVRSVVLKYDIISSQKKFLRHNDISTDRQMLRALFDRMDTSGDGRLDATELKLALRCFIGADLSLEDCKFMIGSVDCDGDGTIDFNEFCESVDQIMLR